MPNQPSRRSFARSTPRPILPKPPTVDLSIPSRPPTPALAPEQSASPAALYALPSQYQRTTPVAPPPMPTPHYSAPSRIYPSSPASPSPLPRNARTPRGRPSQNRARRRYYSKKKNTNKQQGDVETEPFSYSPSHSIDETQPPSTDNPNRNRIALDYTLPEDPFETPTPTRATGSHESSVFSNQDPFASGIPESLPLTDNLTDYNLDHLLLAQPLSGMNPNNIGQQSTFQMGNDDTFGGQPTNAMDTNMSQAQEANTFRLPAAGTSTQAMGPLAPPTDPLRFFYDMCVSSNQTEFNENEQTMICTQIDANNEAQREMIYYLANNEIMAWRSRTHRLVYRIVHWIYTRDRDYATVDRMLRERLDNFDRIYPQDYIMPIEEMDELMDVQEAIDEGQQGHDLTFFLERLLNW